MTVSLTATEPVRHPDHEYNDVLNHLQTKFALRAASEPLFTTDAPGLFEAYLESFPMASRQHHNCRSCRQFIERFGGLVTIDEKGHTQPAIWVNTPSGYYGPGIAAMAKRVRKAKVTGVFLSTEETLGTPKTGEWTHFAVKRPSTAVYRGDLYAASQVAAQKREDFGTLQRGLREFSLEVITKALALLRSEALYRSEKVIGPAEWLFALQTALTQTPNVNRSNLVWRAVATAPVGFCTPRSTMIGTLLEDIAAGMPTEAVASRFAAKMNPTQYQRPQAAPKAGAIDAAEKLFEKLGLARSLERRFARLDEIETIWKPALPKEQATGSLFGHLKPLVATSPSMPLPKTPITLVKFLKDVLPHARSIELRSTVGGRDHFAAIVTATHLDAPPILQWDTDEQRNPASWYLYNGGSYCSRWNLQPDWNRVTALSLQPSMWFGDRFPHQGSGVLFVLAGARDLQSQSLALFPETLKSELHGVRSVIEAHSKSGKLSGLEEASACGYLLQKNATTGPRVRVVCDLGSVREYQLDRWD